MVLGRGGRTNSGRESVTITVCYWQVRNSSVRTNTLSRYSEIRRKTWETIEDHLEAVLHTGCSICWSKSTKCVLILLLSLLPVKWLITYLLYLTTLQEAFVAVQAVLDKAILNLTELYILVPAAYLCLLRFPVISWGCNIWDK